MSLLMIETLLRGEAVDLVVRDRKMQDRVEGLLAARGIAITQEQRHVIAGCHDAAQLRTWVTRAAIAASAAEVLAEG